MPPKRGKPKAAAATEVISTSRFNTLKVNERISIKNFVEKHKLKFATGRGFYQLTKPETIQFHKEIVVRRKSDDTMASGDEVKLIHYFEITSGTDMSCILVTLLRRYFHPFYPSKQMNRLSQRLSSFYTYKQDLIAVLFVLSVTYCSKTN